MCWFQSLVMRQNQTATHGLSNGSDLGGGAFIAEAAIECKSYCWLKPKKKPVCDPNHILAGKLRHNLRTNIAV
jgi:hypothetical protein